MSQADEIIMEALDELPAHWVDEDFQLPLCPNWAVVCVWAKDLMLTYPLIINYYYALRAAWARYFKDHNPNMVMFQEPWI